MKTRFFHLFIAALLLVLTIVLLKQPISGGFVVGDLLDPLDGLYHTAVMADRLPSETLDLDGLDRPVTVIRDERGVPHIFAESDRDATMALGYVVAQDRLFELDFIPRAASGRLAEVMGASAVNTDRFFRRLGLHWAAHKNVEWLRRSNSPQLEIIQWYQQGVNSYVAGLDVADDPFEFRILGYRPRPFRIEDALLVLEYMNFDLSYRGFDSAYSVLKEALGPVEFERLYPRFSRFFVPIVPPEEEFWKSGHRAGADPDRGGGLDTRFSDIDTKMLNGSRGSWTEGLIPGKGSNNWAVAGSRSSTGVPILAGDMHLNLSLPAIWYEAQLVTPTMNTYGVTIPGAPVIVEGITPNTAWTFTNTAADQIDLYALDVNSEGTGYTVDGKVLPLVVVSDTIRVARGSDVVYPLYYSRFGPVFRPDSSRAVAVRWVAHDSTRTLFAIWKMNHARDYEAFKEATRSWDSPMQNILYADRSGMIAIRSTGYLPLRGGDTGAVVLDGTTAANDWTGRVPFDELPYVENPARGYLTSTNQQPVQEGYPYYLGIDWRDAYRSIRIDSLLRRRARHSPEQIASYQSDVHAVQADMFIPLLGAVQGRSSDAESIRSLLLAWNGETTVDRIEPILFHTYLTTLKKLAFDEKVFKDRPAPADTRLYGLLLDDPGSPWLDRPSTQEVETGPDLMVEALEETAEKFGDRLRKNRDDLKWGKYHILVVRHITRSPALRATWRGPFPWPGYRQTLSPGDALTTTGTASWRVVVDFSSSPPDARGVYPGGQSGNPFSTRYDAHMKTFLNFEYYQLRLPETPSGIPEDVRLQNLTLTPGS